MTWRGEKFEFETLLVGRGGDRGPDLMATDVIHGSVKEMSRRDSERRQCPGPNPHPNPTAGSGLGTGGAANHGN